MLKFINSLAIIEVNQEVGAIQVTFRGVGTPEQYSETLNMTSSFAHVHGCYNYFLIKETFEDIDSAYFSKIIEHWIEFLESRLTVNSCQEKIKVALLINEHSWADINDMLKPSQGAFLHRFPHMDFNLDTNYPQTLHFLQSSISKSEQSVAR